MSKNTPILIPGGKSVLLFDGVCNLCNGFVQFVLKRDKKGQFLFASLQSQIGKQLMEKHQICIEELSSVVLISEEGSFTESDAVLWVVRAMGGFLSVFFSVAYILPKPFRDRLYRFIAKNRYRLFGIKESCMLPRPEWRSRFLDVS